jgi:hypothetical protein
VFFANRNKIKCGQKSLPTRRYNSPQRHLNIRQVSFAQTAGQLWVRNNVAY